MPMIRALWPLRLLLAGLACLLFMPGAAQAGCTAKAGSVNIGPVNSFDAAAGGMGASGSTGLTCTGNLLGLLSESTIDATITSVTNSLSNQPRLRNAAGDYIPFAICQNAACSTVYGVGSSIRWRATSFLDLLGLFGSPGETLPIYIKIQSGTAVSAGTYSSSINFAWAWSYCGVGIGPICLPDKGTTATTVAITLTVTRDCSISAPALSFGSAAFVGSFNPVTRTIEILCSKDAAYTVGIDDGKNFSGSRRLGNGGAYIAYDVYYPASSTTRWGRVGAERRSSAAATGNPGSYNGEDGQSYTYKAAILPGQPTPPSGTYTDILTIDIQF